MTDVKELTKNEFEDFIKEGVVLVDFWAGWCMPCLMMEPVIEGLSKTFKGKVKFAKVDIEENQAIAQKFDVSSIPTFILFKKGKQIEQFVGSMSAEDFEKKLRGFI